MQSYSCPRCSGKGYIDTKDIERLGKTNNWVPGLCFYCNGLKTVDSSLTNNVSPLDDFLSSQRSEEERLLYARDPQSFIEFNTIFFEDEINQEYRLKLIAAGMDAKKSFLYDYKSTSEITVSLIEKKFRQEEVDKIMTYIAENPTSATATNLVTLSDTDKPPLAIRIFLCVVLVVTAVLIFKSLGTSVIVFRFIIGAVIIFVGKIIMSWGID